MSAIGKIRNVKGFMNETELYLKQFGDEWYLSRRYLMGIKTRTIKLTGELSYINAQNMMETSAGGTASRAVLSGLGAMAWNNHRAISGGLLGLASSIDTRKAGYIIELTFHDGRQLTGKTNHDVVQTLISISPQMSDSDRQKRIDDELKFQRFLEDAPRTYHENKAELDRLRIELAQHEHDVENGETFNGRERAKEFAEDIKQQIQIKETLDQELSTRAKAIKKVGSYDEYMKHYPKLAKRKPTLESRLKFSKFLAYSCPVMLLATFLISNEDIQALAFMWFLLTLIYLLQYWILKPLRKRSLVKVTKRLQEYDISDVKI